jgi:phage terminase large subunit GpA-like protein
VRACVSRPATSSGWCPRASCTSAPRRASTRRSPRCRCCASASPSRTRDQANNNDIKEYVGGALYAGHRRRRGEPVRAARAPRVFDEIDRAKENVGGEGDPTELAEARQTTHERNRKTYYPSSPTIEASRSIEALFKRGTQRVALAECIHCGHAQPLDFFKLIRSEDGKRAMYPCEECGGLHEEGDKTRMFARGLWSAGVPGDGETESFTISAMFLPYGWMPWVSLMRQYDAAKAKLEEGSEEAMIVFYNTRLALCWARRRRPRSTTSCRRAPAATSWARAGRRPPHGGDRLPGVPPGVQGHRLGRGHGGWVVDYQVIQGSPAEIETWEKADELLQSRLPPRERADAEHLGAFIDSGGKGARRRTSTTSPRRKRRGIFAVKGHSRPNRPILSGKPTVVDINWRGKTEKRGAQLWLIGPDTAKDYLQARWKRVPARRDPLPRGLPESYFKGLTAEYRTYGYKRGRKVSWWEQKKGRGERAAGPDGLQPGARRTCSACKRKRAASGSCCASGSCPAGRPDSPAVWIRIQKPDEPAAPGVPTPPRRHAARGMRRAAGATEPRRRRAISLGSGSRVAADA